MKFFHAFILGLFLFFSGLSSPVFADEVAPPADPKTGGNEQFESIQVNDIFSTQGANEQDSFTYEDLIEDSQGNTPGNGNHVIAIMLNVIDVLLLLIGTFAFIAVAYGGFLFMQAGGDEGKIDAGKTILTQAVLGLVIAFSSYIVVRFVESFFS